MIVSLKIKGASKSLEEWSSEFHMDVHCFARPSVTIVKRNFENIGNLVSRHTNYFGFKKKTGGHGKRRGIGEANKSVII